MPEKKLEPLVKIWKVENGYILLFDPEDAPYKCHREVYENWEGVPPAMARYFGEKEVKKNASTQSHKDSS